MRLMGSAAVACGEVSHDVPSRRGRPYCLSGGGGIMKPAVYWRDAGPIAVIEQIEISAKYAGYIVKQQNDEVERAALDTSIRTSRPPI
jgi:hypothetical protein